jgi:hypothetical protein
MDYLPSAAQIEVFPSSNAPLYRTGGERGLSLDGHWETSLSS